jgi:hypothetical protein
LQYCYSIKPYDVSYAHKGPVFPVPITAVHPLQLPLELLRPELHFANVAFKPNTVWHYFILVPDEATWAGKSSIKLYKNTQPCFQITAAVE